MDKEIILNNIANNYKSYFELGVGLKSYMFIGGDITYLNSKINDPFFNTILDYQNTSILYRKLQDLIINYIETGYSFRCIEKSSIIRELINNENCISKYGMELTHEKSNIYWFQPTNLNIPKHNSIENIRFHIVNKTSELNDWWIPFQDSFNNKPEDKQFIIDFNKIAKYKEPENFYNIIGYLDSLPIVCATVFINSNMTCIFDLGTKKEYRRKGMGTAMMNYVLNNFCRQSKYGVGLYSTTLGDNLYRKMGLTLLDKIDMHYFTKKQATVE